VPDSWANSLRSLPEWLWDSTALSLAFRLFALHIATSTYTTGYGTNLTLVITDFLEAIAEAEPLVCSITTACKHC